MFAKLFGREPIYAGAIEEKAYSGAVLDELGLGFFLNGVLGDICAARTAHMRERIAEKRKWASGLTNAKWRVAYDRWLDHAEYCCKKADQYREEWPEKDARWREMEAERNAVAQLSRNLPPPL
jgi:hypothetical protein